MRQAPFELDVRPVEPKHRFGRIMGAYEELEEGEALVLTVDHDPMCFYYTLRATRGEGTFDFSYQERGPERWRVCVRKLHEAVPARAREASV